MKPEEETGQLIDTAYWYSSRVLLWTNENTVWTDSQDYGADEILDTIEIVIFKKINWLMHEIIILFEVYPQLSIPSCPSEMKMRGRIICKENMV